MFCINAGTWMQEVASDDERTVCIRAEAIIRDWFRMEDLSVAILGDAAAQDTVRRVQAYLSDVLAELRDRPAEQSPSSSS